MKVLRGRLVFAEAQIFGRLTGVHMKQLSRFETLVGGAQIDEELKRSLRVIGSSMPSRENCWLMWAAYITCIQMPALKMEKGDWVECSSMGKEPCFPSSPKKCLMRPWILLTP